MSRFGDYDGDGDDRYNGGDLWTKRVQLALEGRRGRKALADLRDALMALPEHRLIEGALCTVGIKDRIAAMPETKVVQHWKTDEPIMVENYDRTELIEFAAEYEQPEGVCAIGAYVWWQKVKGGMDPVEAFAALPVGNQGEEETVDAGQAAGLTFTLAWDLANRNDEQWASATPEQRWERFVAFIDRQLAKPPLKWPAPRPKRAKRQPMAAIARVAKGAPTMGLPW